MLMEIGIKMVKITFKRQGCLLIAEYEGTSGGYRESRKAVIVDRGYQFDIEFFRNNEAFETTRAFNINDAKEEARKYLRGWENTPEFTGKGYKK